VARAGGSRAGVATAPELDRVGRELEHRVRLQPVERAALVLVDAEARDVEPALGREVLAAARARRLLDALVVLMLHAEAVVA
jgi:hypothetical protein